MRDARGFTLIELLIVVAIIGIVASIAVPNLMNAMHRAKQNSTMGNIRAMGQAVERYAIDNNTYPVVTNLGNLAQQLEPTYIKDMPTRDGWGNTLVYQAEPGGYTIRSTGKDGVLQASPPGGVVHSFDDDIIYINAQFIQYPEGKQE